jgi:hypothetical protein
MDYDQTWCILSRTLLVTIEYDKNSSTGLISNMYPYILCVGPYQWQNCLQYRDNVLIMKTDNNVLR